MRVYGNYTVRVMKSVTNTCCHMDNGMTDKKKKIKKKKVYFNRLFLQYTCKEEKPLNYDYHLFTHLCFTYCLILVIKFNVI